MLCFVRKFGAETESTKSTPVDISNLKPPKNVSKDLQDSEALLAKNRVPLVSSQDQFVGDQVPVEKARNILILTRCGFVFDMAVKIWKWST
jgi:hypothetical protein